MNKLCLDKTAIQNIHFEYGLVLQSKCQEIKKNEMLFKWLIYFHHFFHPGQLLYWAKTIWFIQNWLAVNILRDSVIVFLSSIFGYIMHYIWRTLQTSENHLCSSSPLALHENYGQGQPTCFLPYILEGCKSVSWRNTPELDFENFPVLTCSYNEWKVNMIVKEIGFFLNCYAELDIW